jgi:hypothetical protein
MQCMLRRVVLIENNALQTGEDPNPYNLRVTNCHSGKHFVHEATVEAGRIVVEERVGGKQLIYLPANQASLYPTQKLVFGRFPAKAEVEAQNR